MATSWRPCFLLVLETANKGAGPPGSRTAPCTRRDPVLPHPAALAEAQDYLCQPWGSDSEIAALALVLQRQLLQHGPRSGAALAAKVRVQQRRRSDPRAVAGWHVHRRTMPVRLSLGAVKPRCEAGELQQHQWGSQAWTGRRFRLWHRASPARMC